jgi:hypothetical protein
MVPQQDRDIANHGTRPRANTTFSSFAWRRDRQVPATPVTSTLPASLPMLSLEALIEVLTPPNQPSLAHARSLASILPTYSPILPPSTLNPILMSLCSARSPVSLQVAGYEIISAYHENNELDVLDTPDRLTLLSFVLRPSEDWSQEIWEPRFRALRASTKYGTNVLGVESTFLKVLKTWIRGAFQGLVGPIAMDATERAERERAVEILSKFLMEVIRQDNVVSRVHGGELTSILHFYASLVEQAVNIPPPLPRDVSVLSFGTPDSSAPCDGTPTVPTQAHRRHPSSLSLPPSHSTVVLPIKHPADLLVGIYLDHLTSQLKTMSQANLEYVIPHLFRMLAFYATPLPRLSISSPTLKSAPLEVRVSETLDSLLCGPYATTCMIILQKYLLPPAPSRQQC